MEDPLPVVTKVTPQRLFIDSLSEIRLLAREPHWYWKQLLYLKSFFLERKCTVLLSEIPTGGDTSAIHSVIHGKIVLEYDIPVYGPDRRRIRINKLQGQEFSSGYHDMKIQTGGMQVFPRLIAAEHRSRFEARTISTGNRELDDFIGGGLDVGNSILLTGPSGSLKTIFATQIAVAAAGRGEKSVLYIFDERINTLTSRADSFGLKLGFFRDQEMIRIKQIDPAECTPGEFSYMVQQEVESGCSLVVIDSLNGYSYAMPEERFLSVHLHELSSYLNQMEITTLFIMSTQWDRHGQAGTPFDVSYIADTVIEHHLLMRKGYARKALSIYKRRSGPHDKRIRELLATERGIALGDALFLPGTEGETVHPN
jgi:circadian clock protein KaiC